MNALAMLDRDAFYREWIAALRSGEYKQGFDRLVDIAPFFGDKTYCCLGVACDLAAKWGFGKWEGDRFTVGAAHPDYDERYALDMPPDLAALLQLDVLNPRDGSNNFKTSIQCDLADENDSRETSFSEIADMIELYAVSIAVEV